jgi:hypothetical protein
MKLTKSQLKQIIKEELNEITADEAGAAVEDAMRPLSGIEQGEEIVTRHMWEIVDELHKKRLTPRASPGEHSPWGDEPPRDDWDQLAKDMYRMIMRELTY